MHCECCIKWWWVNYLLHGRNCCATSLASRSLARVHLLTHLQTLQSAPWSERCQKVKGTLFCDLGKLSSSWEKLLCYKLSLQIASSRTLAHSLSCLVHVVHKNLISKRRGQALLFSFEYNLLPNFNHYMDRASSAWKNMGGYYTAKETAFKETKINFDLNYLVLINSGHLALTFVYKKMLSMTAVLIALQCGFFGKILDNWSQNVLINTSDVLRHLLARRWTTIGRRLTIFPFFHF